MDFTLLGFVALPMVIAGAVPIASAIWVYDDCKKAGVRKGMTTGIFDMGPLGWSLCVTALWLPVFIIYLVKRKTLAHIAKETADLEKEGDAPFPGFINRASKSVAAIWSWTMILFAVFWLVAISGIFHPVGSEAEKIALTHRNWTFAVRLIIAWAVITLPAVIVYMITKEDDVFIPIDHPHETEKTKKCPFCAETIKADAKFCRFCSHDLPQEEKPIPQNKEKHWEEQGREDCRRGEYMPAAAAFTQSLRYKESARVFYLRALAFAKAGDKEKAREDLKTAAAMGHKKAAAALAKRDTTHPHEEASAQT
ncbi:hypothetical protein JWG39_13725 [Desulforhopalus vacuolatus]|uniref:hypothetical protein n=1 Tax=Desulforhopalus vacuolatus TaxID=40414 RepID=UPI001963059B|nr:hypothetical protein [Desulforhopalus vacuolatus]MBM9520875.1 hypothetical protein [Desulforhopalus vacuolatus]